MLGMIKWPAKNVTSVVANSIVWLVLLIFLIDYFIDFKRELLVISATISILVILILVIRYKQLLLLALSFVVPLSVPFSLGTSQISLPSELIATLLTCFFLFKVINGKKLDLNFLSHPVTLLILLDLLWIFISSFFSQLPEVSFKRFIIRLCYYVAFYYFYYELFTNDASTIKKVFNLHVMGFLVPIIYAFFNHASLDFTTVGSQRISAPFYFDHTVYGACLVFFIPFIFFFFFNSIDKRQRIFYGALLIVFVLAAILSYSRAAWISLFFSAGVAVILKYRIKFKYLFFAVLLAIIAGILNFADIARSMKENKEISHSNNVTMHFKSISNINNDASNKERINRWKCALRMFADKPITGFGPGTYQFFYGQYQMQEDMTRISTYNGTKGHAHSEYLNYLSETGLPGLLIFLSLLTTVCTTALKLYKRNISGPQSNMILFILPALTTYLVHAFFNGFLEFDKMAMPVFMSFAAVCFLDNNFREEKRRKLLICEYLEKSVK